MPRQRREHYGEDPWTYYERNQEYFGPEIEGGYDPARDRFVKTPEHEEGQYPEDRPHQTYFRSTYQFNPFRERQTERAPGMRREGPFVGVGPKGYRRSDERILDEICMRLTAHTSIDARDIFVIVEDGVVRLTGSTHSWPSKCMAEDLVESVPGVRDVQNELRISRPGWADDLSQA